jgi:hypothetical protein
VWALLCQRHAPSTFFSQAVLPRQMRASGRSALARQRAQQPLLLPPLLLPPLLQGGQEFLKRMVVRS